MTDQTKTADDHLIAEGVDEEPTESNRHQIGRAHV